MEVKRNIRNIGIFAHVDAGKTTLTEQILQHCGMIREKGSVDAGTAHTDSMDIERRRGISIRSTVVRASWQGVDIHIIDTPGHTDFAAEVERSLWVLDGAVLVLSAVEGVQPQTEVLFKALEKRGIPTILFINKADRDGADVQQAVEQARSVLSGQIVWPAHEEQVLACWAETDDQALAYYIEGKRFPKETLETALLHLAKEGKAYPVFAGSALKDVGIDALLDAMVGYLPAPKGDETGPVSGIVFAVAQDKLFGRAAMVRLFSGTLQNRDRVQYIPVKSEASIRQPEPVEVKIAQIRRVALEGRGEELAALQAGDIGMVYGLGAVKAGQMIGDASYMPRDMYVGEMHTPLLMAKIKPKQAAQKNELRKALEWLNMEDPLLRVTELVGELHVRVMGAIQLEVLEDLIASRFGIEVRFEKPTIIYKETIAQPATGFFAYTMPKPCWAVIQFLLEPLPRGSGIQYASVVNPNQILPRYQHQIEQALPIALRQGMLGWQVEDVRITLTGGEHHAMHTHPLDFVLATPVAFMDGLQNAGTVLLEPIIRMEMRVPESTCSKILGEVILMRGEIVDSTQYEERAHVVADVPLAASVDFSTRLAALTGGRGSLSMRLIAYKECEQSPEKVCPRNGVHPLDTAKYILAARSAMGDGVFTTPNA